MQIAVTGGGGFIGAWIVRKLAEAGHDPVVFDLHSDRSKLAQIAGSAMAERIRWIAGDICETDDLVAATRGCQGIVHLAGLLTPACRENPVLGARVNLIGTVNAFLAARENGIGHVSYMSSTGVFGPDGGPEPRPTTLYGAYKLGAEHCARAFLVEDGITSTGFRPYVVYGPGRDAGLSAGPSLACRAAARGEAYTIPFTGPVDLIHAGDVARIFVADLAQRKRGAHTVNLLGTAADITEVATMIRQIIPDAKITANGPPMPITTPQEEPLLTDLFPDWRPMPLKEGLADTIDYYRVEPVPR
ncbi:MAG: NAD-dependent epimerase/dehydratase family protein [Pseudorhodobacter sp.]